MFGRRKLLSLPKVVVAVMVGIVSGKAIFGPPVDEYWRKKLQEDAQVKQNNAEAPK